MASARQTQRKANKTKLYRDIGKAVKSKNLDLVEKLSTQLYKYQSASEKKILKEHMNEKQIANPAKAYGKALTDALMPKYNSFAKSGIKSFTRKDIEQTQKYFGLRLSDEERAGINAMKNFRKSQRKDYEAFRRLSKAPNSYEAIGRELQYKGGNINTGYKYHYTDKDGNKWEIITPRYDEKNHMNVGFTFSQTAKAIKPKDEDTVFQSSFYS